MLNHRHLLAAAALAALAASSLVAPVLAGESALDQALAAYRKGEYAKVIEVAETVKKDDPTRVRALYVAGEAHLELGDPNKAESSFRTVLKDNPAAVPAIVGLGRALAAGGDEKAAKAELERAVKLDKKDAYAQRSLGQFLVEQDKPAAARKALSAAHKLDPKDPLAASSLVSVLLSLEQEKKALSVAKKLTKETPDSPMGHFLMGLVHDKAGDDDDAIEAYEAAIEKDDKCIDAHKNLAIIGVARNPMYRDTELAKKSLKHFEKYFELGGKDKELRQTYNTIKGFLDQYLNGK